MKQKDSIQSEKRAKNMLHMCIIIVTSKSSCND